jgi:hypothetical protein
MCGLSRIQRPRPPKIAREVDERLGKKLYEPAARGRLIVLGRCVDFCALSTAVVSLLGGRARSFRRGCIGLLNLHAGPRRRLWAAALLAARAHNPTSMGLTRDGPLHWRRGRNRLRPGTFRVPASRLCMQGSGSKGSAFLPPAGLLRIVAASLPGIFLRLNRQSLSMLKRGRLAPLQ